MKIIFEQTTSEYTDLLKNSLKRRKGLLVFITIMIALASLNLLRTIFKGGWDAENLLSWTLPMLLIALIWYIIFMLIRKRMMNSKDNKLMFGRREIDFFDENFTCKTEISNTTFQWNSVTELAQSSKNYFLYMGKRQAIIIPKSALESETQKAKFENLITRKMNKT